MRSSQEKAIEKIFNGAADIEAKGWSLKLAPPGHEFHRPEYIEDLAQSIAQVQSGLSALRRAIKRKRRQKKEGVQA